MEGLIRQRLDVCIGGTSLDLMVLLLPLWVKLKIYGFNLFLKEGTNLCIRPTIRPTITN